MITMALLNRRVQTGVATSYCNVARNVEYRGGSPACSDDADISEGNCLPLFQSVRTRSGCVGTEALADRVRKLRNKHLLRERSASG
jgi:hypothetical protein